MGPFLLPADLQLAWMRGEGREGGDLRDPSMSFPIDDREGINSLIM